jgi:methylated-DNA-[protein]-cysteine S-methyltransferase
MTVPTELDRRFRDAAAAESLLDVAYDLVSSPIGPLLVGVSPRGLCRISFEGEAALEDLAARVGERVLRSPRPVEGARRELDEYFDGRRHEFGLQVDFHGLPAFQQTVLEELVRVRYGEVATYGALAARVGKPRAARAVGGALNRNPIPIVVPCHRIVGASGALVGYAGGLERKQALLELEGVALDGRARVP